MDRGGSRRNMSNSNNGNGGGRGRGRDYHNNQRREFHHGAVFDPIFTRNKILERENQQHVHAILTLQEIIAELEDANRMNIERMQQMNAEFNFQRMQMRQDFENEKGVIMNKIKSETLAQYLQNGGGFWQHDPYNASDLQSGMPGLGIGIHQVPFLLQDMLTLNGQQHNHNQSQCLQPMPNPNGDGTLTDLRDRYEDVKAKGSKANLRKPDTSELLSMMRKVVRYYEAQGMRVYEESLSNKCVSTLIWCPEHALYPDKFEAAFAMGCGNTEEEATENSIHQAYFMIKNQTQETGNAESGDGDGDTNSDDTDEKFQRNQKDKRTMVHLHSCRVSKSHPAMKPRTVLSMSSSGCGISIQSRSASVQSLDQEQIKNTDIPKPENVHSPSVPPITPNLTEVSNSEENIQSSLSISEIDVEVIEDIAETH